MNVEKMTSKEISDYLANHGIKMHFNSKREKLEAAFNELTLSTEDNMEDDNQEVTEVTETEAVNETANPEKAELTVEQDALRLIRVIVRPNDPLKQESTGDIFTIGSSVVNNGRAIKKYIPYNNEEGWHIPNIIYQNLKAAKCQVFKREKRDGEDVMVPHMIRAYNIEVLDPLTPEELKKLADRQKAHNTLGT